mmetsp:Transcript_30395/g.55113  ORF Transcript_30395/g.55113 Transcript_30395/m.55113 type:complete len:392 (+) Transcript_30395:121-1296(+)
MWSRLKYFAYVTGLVGLALVIAEDKTKTESHAARFANFGSIGVDGSERTSILKEESNAVENMPKPVTMAKSTQMRTLKLFPKDRKRQLRVRAGQRTGGGGGGANRRDGADAINRQNEKKNRNGTNRRNGNNSRNRNDGASIVNANTVKLNRQADNSERNANRQNGNGRNGDKNRNGISEASGMDANNMKLNSRQKDKDKEQDKVQSNRKSNKKPDQLKLKARKDDESIAETLARTQLKLRPETRIKKRTQQSSASGNNAFPYRYPKIRYVPWNKLSKDTKEIVEKIFGYYEGSWNYMSHIIESKAFSDLTKSQQKNALFLGIDENVWDCFINHYASYNKQDLVRLGLYEHVTTLSNVISKTWEQLSKDEIQAATKLCYSKEVWNKETLGTW